MTGHFMEIEDLQLKKSGVTTTTIKYDKNVCRGPIKAMHGVGQPPRLGLDFSYFKYLADAHIPYSRLHDVGGWFGGNMFVDIPNIFRDFNADVNDPASYDFVFTDMLLAALIKNGCEPYYRLGVTIENFHEIKAYRIYPPADFKKWAEICEHIIRHYNEGWADGFHYGIKYWEIWNEPEDSYDPSENAMWKGTPEEFFDLYRVTSRHLRECFGDSIKIGGYAACENSGIVNEKVSEALRRGKGADLSDLNMSRWDMRRVDFVDFFEKFTKMVADEGLPFDFFSHHSYNTVENNLKMQKFAENRLDELGLSNVEIHLNEWNPCSKREKKGASATSAKTAAMMCALHGTRANVMCYYDAKFGMDPYAGLFNPLTFEPFCTYYSFKAFGELYNMGTEIACSSDNPSVYALAATDGKKIGILISNIGEDTTLTLETNDSYTVYLIDEDHMMEKIDIDLTGYALKQYQVLYVEINSPVTT